MGDTVKKPFPLGSFGGKGPPLQDLHVGADQIGLLEAHDAYMGPIWP